MHTPDGPVADCIYYINLDRVPERRAFMEAEFARVGLAGAHRLSAIDASQPGALDGARYVPGSGSRWGLLPSEVGCFESHRRVWEIGVERGLPAVVAFEDDVELSGAAADVIQTLVRNADKFDYVKLDYWPRVRRFGPSREIGGVEVREILEMVASAAAYVVSQRGCRKLLEWSEEYSDHLDDFLTIPRPDWAMYQCFPAVCAQAIVSQPDAQTVIKTSEREQDVRINSGLDKGPTWFRVARELKAAGRKLYWRAGGQSRLLRRGGYVGLVPCADDLEV
ncbi:Glycosyltransferase involved in LPS biosynthesis, GR25 family [Ruegeria intermedia]|uniref:Glycosyltransferase involved in LPS biosynthesis, GR25 family n=1 Tax=Ruegeria intermedia TaxID=996115 RepID=A0A1M4VQ83_9RHOB|nr:glycosyltransferase family 25 protein [Ruegeria intermedia]SHE71007.1 Glycosyltransferase involved in LPS biosynthesis, GR25 family [Ruegeria intermedia]